MRETTQVQYAREGHVARLTFNRPQQLNALSPTLIEEALDVARQVAESDARVLVVSGRGKSFSAGVDLKAVSTPGYTRETAKRFSEQARELGRLFETMKQATIAQVSGYCFTGGLELALACDLIVASSDAVFCDSHAKLGLRPGWGLSQRLPRRIGVMRAKEMSFTGRRVSAAEAAAMGLILESLPARSLQGRIAELADQITLASANSITAYKALYRGSQTLGLDDGLAFETDYRGTRPSEAERTPLSRHLKPSS